jgi:stage II sporulation protein D
MRKRTQEILLAIILGVFVPIVAFGLAEKLVERRPEKEMPHQEQVPTGIPSQTGREIAVQFSEGNIRMMELEEYITGVVLAEMPASFESEALKAQAVVARTYALKRALEEGKHPSNAVCTDPACCQAYVTEEQFLQMNGQQYDKVCDAVLQTEGLVLVYEGDLIEATYFSCSGGRTEDAVAVWGGKIPYLVSVESPGEQHAEHYVDTVFLDKAVFCEQLDLTTDAVTEHGIGEITSTAGGGVDTIQIGGETFTGVQVRQLLGLRSTAFRITIAGTTVTITTKGYGHRVGMSQYGADAMAVAGHDYRDILAHYYPGTCLQEWLDN